MESTSLEGNHNGTSHMFNYITLGYTSMDSEQQQDQSSTDTISGTYTLIEI